MPYTKNHRRFLNIIMNNGIMDIQKAFHICADIWDEENEWNTQRLHSMIKEINGKISEFYQEIRIVHCEISNTEKVVFLETVNDEISRCQDPHTPAELEFFKLILINLVTSDDYALSIVSCMNLKSQLPYPMVLPLVRTEELINLWSNSGYFIQTEDDCLKIGPRTAAEFEPYFNREYKDCVENCVICHSIIFYVIMVKNVVIALQRCTKTVKRSLFQKGVRCVLPVTSQLREYRSISFGY